MRAKVDILSNSSKDKSKQVYCKAGDPLELISRDHWPVLIVKFKNQQPFPAHIDKVYNERSKF